MGAFVLGENDFRKSFSPKPACLVATKNAIFRKSSSCWPKFTPLTRKWIYTLIFTSIHFQVTQEHKEIKESERKNVERAKRTATQREREKERELRSSHQELRAQNAQQHRESERKNPLLWSTSCQWRRVQPDDHRPDQRPNQLTSIQTNARSSSASRSPVQPFRSPSQT